MWGSGYGVGMDTIRQMHRLIPRGVLPASTACLAAGVVKIRLRTFVPRFVSKQVPSLRGTILAFVWFAPEVVRLGFGGPDTKISHSRPLRMPLLWYRFVVPLWRHELKAQKDPGAAVQEPDKCRSSVERHRKSFCRLGRRAVRRFWV